MGLFWNSAVENRNIRSAKEAAAGRGPSVARTQLAAGLGQAQNAMYGQAAGVRQNPLAAMRQAQNTGSQMATTTNQQAAMMKAQEMQAGEQRLAGIAQQDAADQSALIGGLTSMGGTMLSGGLSAMGGAPAPAPTPYDPQTGQRMNLGNTSDINAKNNIQPAGARTDALLANIRPEQYNYNDPAQHGQGNRLGVMAQDLQRADPNLVDRQPDGNLAINGPAALSASLAANARLAQRLDAIEARTGSNASQMSGIAAASRGPAAHVPELSVPISLRERGITPEQWASASPRVRAEQSAFDESRSRSVPAPPHRAKFDPTPSEIAARDAQYARGRR